MKKLNLLLLAGVAAVMFFPVVPSSQAQVRIGVNIGAPPVCPYGYYDYAPYNCAPYGYYGPEWFTGGLFLGAGPWFHGPHGFYGHVDHRYDPRFGYRGPFPEHGDRRFDHFHGNEWRDGQGHFHSEADHPRFVGGGHPEGHHDDHHHH